MELALRKAYDAIPEPKIVIAVGACAISGGPYLRHPEQCGGAEAVVPVDLYVPGCPPHPYTILEGLLGLLDRLPVRSQVQPAAPRLTAALSRMEEDAKEWGRERAESEMRSLGVDLGRGDREEEP
jgi:Ni,Fe-hydrogenase III small subunit